jgi:hypothetical protein
MTCLAMLLTSSACDEGPLFPDGVAGVYHLASINGQGLPFTYVASPLGGYAGVTIDQGALHLREDRTWGWGVGGVGYGLLAGRVASFESGTYVGSDNRFRLIPEPGPLSRSDTLELKVAGDSAVLDAMTTLGQFRYAFQRGAVNIAAMTRHTYLLTSIDGRGPPFLVFDTVYEFDRYVEEVLFDTIAFVDEVFYRQHRHERKVLYPTDGDSSWSSLEWTGYGSYAANTGLAVLRPYGRVGNMPSHDTLQALGAELLRETWSGSRMRQDRYTCR